LAGERRVFARGCHRATSCAALAFASLWRGWGAPSAFAGEVDSDVVMLGLVYAAPLSTSNPR
jgi:hypothetical protein